MTSLQRMIRTDVFPGDVFRRATSGKPNGQPALAFVWDVNDDGTLVLSTMYAHNKSRGYFGKRFRISFLDLWDDWEQIEKNPASREFRGVGLRTAVAA